MANKRTLNVDLEDKTDPCAKKQKISGKQISLNLQNKSIGSCSPILQVDGFSDETDGRNFRFAPNSSLAPPNFSQLSTNYAPLERVGSFPLHVPSKIPQVGERHFLSSNHHFDAFMPHFTMPQRLLKMPSNMFNAPRNLGPPPPPHFQFLSSGPEFYKQHGFNRTIRPEQEFVHLNNGAQHRMMYSPYSEANFGDQSFHLKNSQLSGPLSNDFSNKDQHLLMNGFSGNNPKHQPNAFPLPSNRRDYNDLPFKEPGLINPFSENCFLLNNVENSHTSQSNGIKLFPGHFPYPFNITNIPENSVGNLRAKPQVSPMQHTQQNEHLLSYPPHSQPFGLNAFDSFPKPYNWNPGLPDQRNYIDSRAMGGFPLSDMHHASDKFELPEDERSDHRDVSKSSKDYPMKMIENFSASHFVTSKSFSVGANIENLNSKNSVGEKVDKNDQGSSYCELNSNNPQMSSSHSKNGHLSDSFSNYVAAEKQTQSTNLKSFSSPAEKKNKRNKKNSEQAKYESWLNERRVILQSRIFQLEQMLEQERFSKPPHHPSNDPDQVMESGIHLRNSLIQLRKDFNDHEVLIKVYEDSKNSMVTSKNISRSDKITRPTKRNAVPHHLNSSRFVQPDDGFHPPSSNIFKSHEMHFQGHSHPPMSHKSPVKYDPKQLESLPLPNILEPCVVPPCPVNIYGWSSGDDIKSTGFKLGSHGDFKPSQALNILNTLDDNEASRDLTMNDLSKGGLPRDYNTIPNEASEDIISNQIFKYPEFRVAADWLTFQQNNFTIESCSQCCKPAGEVYQEENVNIEVAGENVCYIIKFCSEDCMQVYKEARKRWERDKLSSMEMMETDDACNQTTNSDLNSTLIYEAINKTLPLELSIMSECVPIPSRKWRNERYGTWCKISHLKKRQKKDVVECEKKDSHVLHSVSVPQHIVDVRTCMLCSGVGDADGNGPGRLLIADINKWVHANCSRWSSYG